MSDPSTYESGVVTRPASASVGDVATVMADSAIGCVIVVDDDHQPIGIVTDRDLCCRVVSRGLDPASARAEDVMSKPVHTARAEDRLQDIVAHMREHGIRRLPVVREGRLVGIITMDDALVWLSRQLDDLGRAIEETILSARAKRHPLGRLFGH